MEEGKMREGEVSGGKGTRLTESYTSYITFPPSALSPSARLCSWAGPLCMGQRMMATPQSSPSFSRPLASTLL